MYYKNYWFLRNSKDKRDIPTIASRYSKRHLRQTNPNLFNEYLHQLRRKTRVNPFHIYNY